jgi:uncharacterized protein YkwD
VLLIVALTAPVFLAEPEAVAQDGGGANIPSAAQMVYELANQARMHAGVGRLHWDPALANAALYHCQRMVAEGPISHRYAGEPDLAARAGRAGAHFSVIEENVAIGPSAQGVHEEWMNSPGHRSNLLSPDVDRVGVAVVESRGVLYAVADYAREVESLSARDVEARVSGMVRANGVSILGDPAQARAACVTDEGVPRGSGSLQPGFIMRWQDSDLSQLPQALADRLASGQYRRAAVGSCPTRGGEGSFTAYRVAVILY